MVFFKSDRWHRALRSSSVILLLAIVYGFGASACCDDDMNYYCLKFTLSPDCEGCSGTGGSPSPAYKDFIVDFGNQRQALSQFATSPWSICFVGNESGGTPINATYTEMCTWISGGVAHATIKKCNSKAGITSPKACDAIHVDVDVPLSCTCITI